MTDRRPPSSASQSPSAPPPIVGRMVPMGPGSMRHGPGGPGSPGGHGPMFGGPVEKAAAPAVTVRRLTGYLGRQRRALLGALAAVLASTALDVASPLLLSRAIDGYILPGDLPGLLRIALLLLAVAVGHAVAVWLRTYMLTGVAQHTVRELRADLFTRLQALPLRYFDQRPHGEIMSRLTNDVENVNTVLSDGLAQLISGALTMVGVAIIMFGVNPLLAAVSIVATAGLTLLLNTQIAPRTRTGFRDQQAAFGALSGLIEETVTGQRVVKAYAREDAVIAQFEERNAALRTSATRAQIVAGFMGPLMNFSGNLSLGVIVFTGGWMALAGSATVGTIAAFIAYARQFGRPLTELANLYNALQSAIAGAERVFAVIDEPAEVDMPAAPALESPDAPLRGDVVFENVNFSYAPDVPVLKSISLHAQPGQVVALVGPTGAGKTTIINVLMRFYEIDAGRILLDGRDLREFGREALRRQLGIVLQDTFLFAGTVMENIRYGRLDATDAEVKAAAALANADTFIHRLPNGYATELSERGSNLSQGQRQLLSIARAILADPRILILDEATSSVDTRTEQHIQQAMRRLMTGRTSFVIAHRLSTIRAADQILVIRGGEIVERGAHDALMAAGGAYARLYAGQFHAEPDAG